MKPKATAFLDKDGLVLAIYMTDINHPWYEWTYQLCGTHKSAIKLNIYEK